NVRAEVHGPNIADVNRDAAVDFKGNALDVFDRFDVTAAADVVLRGTDFENFAAHVAVGHADFGNDIAERDAERGEFIRVEVDLVLLHESADGRDFGDAFD